MTEPTNQPWQRAATEHIRIVTSTRCACSPIENIVMLHMVTHPAVPPSAPDSPTSPLGGPAVLPPTAPQWFALHPPQAMALAQGLLTALDRLRQMQQSPPQ